LHKWVHNQLHKNNPPQPNYPGFVPLSTSYPLENTRPAFWELPCGTEGRGFKSRRSPQNSFSLLHLHLMNRRLLVPSFRIGNNWEQIAKVRPFLLKGAFPEKFTARLKKSCDFR
jgi:hypothetical protein